MRRFQDLAPITWPVTLYAERPTMSQPSNEELIAINRIAMSPPQLVHNLRSMASAVGVADSTKQRLAIRRAKAARERFGLRTQAK